MTARAHDALYLGICRAVVSGQANALDKLFRKAKKAGISGRQVSKMVIDAAKDTADGTSLHLVAEVDAFLEHQHDTPFHMDELLDEIDRSVFSGSTIKQMRLRVGRDLRRRGFHNTPTKVNGVSLRLWRLRDPETVLP